jgi:hypothetical protein
MGPGSAVHRPDDAEPVIGRAFARPVDSPENAPQRPGHETTQAMNMRAAEAIVSNAPKPMKIFPITEV